MTINNDILTNSIEGKNMKYKLTATYDEQSSPHYTATYDNAVDAVNSFNKCVDWGFANEYATYNLYEPSGKCHTKIFWRDGKVSGK